MSNNKKDAVLSRNIIFSGAMLVLLGAITYYLVDVYKEEGTEKFVYSLVLISALIIGIAHILLFIVRKRLENKKTSLDKQKKRSVERYRNAVNYITPFVLVAMLYHFWQKGWVLATVITIILLLDRLNDLLRKNK